MSLPYFNKSLRKPYTLEDIEFRNERGLSPPKFTPQGHLAKNQHHKVVTRFVPGPTGLVPLNDLVPGFKTPADRSVLPPTYNIGTAPPPPPPDPALPYHRLKIQRASDGSPVLDAHGRPKFHVALGNNPARLIEPVLLHPPRSANPTPAPQVQKQPNPHSLAAYQAATKYRAPPNTPADVASGSGFGDGDDGDLGSPFASDDEEPAPVAPISVAAKRYADAATQYSPLPTLSPIRPQGVSAGTQTEAPTFRKPTKAPPSAFRKKSFLDLSSPLVPTQVIPSSTKTKPPPKRRQLFPSRVSIIPAKPAPQSTGRLHKRNLVKKLPNPNPNRFPKGITPGEFNARRLAKASKISKVPKRARSPSPEVAPAVAKTKPPPKRRKLFPAPAPVVPSAAPAARLPIFRYAEEFPIQVPRFIPPVNPSLFARTNAPVRKRKKMVIAPYIPYSMYPK